MYTSKFSKEQILEIIVKYYHKADEELTKAEHMGDLSIEIQFRHKFITLCNLVSELEIYED